MVKPSISTPRFSLDKRASGVLLHITSLPSAHGIGDLGPEAYKFLSFLKESGQRWWQMFPLGPPGISNSPYQVHSAFAGNPLLISLEKLRDDGLLSKADLKFTQLSRHRVEYTRVWRFKKRLFHKAFAIFSHVKRLHAPFEAFCAEQAPWLDDYALFCALKAKHHGLPWEKWEKTFRDKKRIKPSQISASLQYTVRYHQFLQFHFFKQWKELKQAAEAAGIGIIGDMPIFVAHDSADVWAHPELFWLDKNGKSICVAGCPPDYFSRTGQRWGNPLYRWDVLKRQGYGWWIDRFKNMFDLFHSTRLDHFIGFHNYWRIPAHHKTAQHGRWVLGPGRALFDAVFKKLGRLPIIAEDLGAVTPPVLILRDQLKFPGMRVLQFAFSGDPKNPFLPHNFSTRSVVFTGTHDNDTTVGWFRKLRQKDKNHVERYVPATRAGIHWDLIRLSLSSVANLSITPVQDLLGLDSTGRMNVPGTPNGNWRWRVLPGQLTREISTKLRNLTETYGRAE